MTEKITNVEAKVGGIIEFSYKGNEYIYYTLQNLLYKKPEFWTTSGSDKNEILDKMMGNEKIKDIIVKVKI